MTEGPPLTTERPQPTTDCTVVPPQQESPPPKGNQQLSSALLNAANDSCVTSTVADAETTVDNSCSVDWKLVSLGLLCTATWWKYYKQFHPFLHPTMKWQAACILCFAQCRFVLGPLAQREEGPGD